MKIVIRSLLVLLIVLFAKGLTAQEKFGADSVRCVENLSLYKEFVKQKNYKDALMGWRVVFAICPESSRNIYSDGTKIWEYMMEKQKDETLKQKYFDSLIMVYDQRIKYFGNDPRYPEGWILGRKGNDIYKYNQSDVEGAYNCLSKSLELMGKDAEAGILTPLMWASIEMFKAGKIDAEKVVNDYVSASEVVDAAIKDIDANESDPEKKVSKIEMLYKAQENLDNLFVRSDPATCEKIIPIFAPKFEANPDDVDMLKKIVRLLDRQNCTQGELFFKVSERLNELEPSSMASYALAKMSESKENYKDAAEFYKKAIELEKVDTLKAQYNIKLAAITGTRLNNKVAARTYALEAARLKPGWGIPYILIATLYGGSASSCGENEFAKKAAYWVAVDKLIQAKSIDPGCSEEANKLIGIYSAQFPDKEEAFFHNITEGQSVTVECWINETTKARF